MGIEITLTGAEAERYMRDRVQGTPPGKVKASQTPLPEPMEEDEDEPLDLEAKKAEMKRIRAWARKHGFRIAERGRIPSPVLEAYARAAGGR